ncbi:MAG: hypothetical protein ACRC2P_14090, partial [Eubacterium aggregans]
PTAANALYQIKDGLAVDIGGGTTGLAFFEDGVVTDIDDEPTGGAHLSMVLLGITISPWRRQRFSIRIAEGIGKFYRW